MDYFYIIVSSVVIILLILIFTYYGIVIQKKMKQNRSFPPQPPSNCPDYWSLNTDGSCNIPKAGTKNTGSIYDPNGNFNLFSNTTFGLNNDKTLINFSDNGWSAGATSSLCKQKNWSNLNNIMWDGVSNYNGC